MRYFIHLQYDGTNYHGWQIQPNGNTVQEELQRALSTILRQPIEVVGAGRTDTGVHARHTVAHFNLEDSASQTLPTPPTPLKGELAAPPSQLSTLNSQLSRLNRLLPRDIAIQSIEPVADDMHARFSATKRTYHYYVCTNKDVFSRQYAWQIHWPLDIEKMNEAAKLLLGEQDFASFCKVGSDVKTTICNVTAAEWIVEEGAANSPLRGVGGVGVVGGVGMVFKISANRFLRNMVRAIVGTLIEVGRGRMTLEQFQDVLKSKSRTAAGESVPAHALFLERVEYT